MGWLEGVWDGNSMLKFQHTNADFPAGKSPNADISAHMLERQHNEYYKLKNCHEFVGFSDSGDSGASGDFGVSGESCNCGGSCDLGECGDYGDYSVSHNTGESGECLMILVNLQT